MAKIQLSESHGQYMQESGERVLLVITKSHYDQEYGKVEIELKNEKGEIVNNNFGLMGNDGTQNDGALKAFSYFSRVAMGDWGYDEVDDEELVGKFIRADIEMTKSKKANDKGEFMSFANITKTYMTDDKFDVELRKTTPIKEHTLPVSAKGPNTSKSKSKQKAAPVVDNSEDEDWD